MLRGTDFKRSRVKHLGQSATSIGEQPAHPVELKAPWVIEARHIADARERQIAMDPEDRHARDPQLDVDLAEAAPGQSTERASTTGESGRPGAPRLHRQLTAQRENPTAIHAPELRV